MRLLKVLRIARASRLINRLTATWTLHTAFIEAGKFFFYVSTTRNHSWINQAPE